MWHALDARGCAPRSEFGLPTASVHYAPDRPLRLEHLRLDLRVEPEARRVEGAATLRLYARQAVDRVRLDAAELDVERVEDPLGRPLPFVSLDRHLDVELEAPAEPGTHVELTVRYTARPRRGLYFVEPSDFDPHRPREVWSQGQDDDNHHWFPCLDHVGDKARTEVIVWVPAGTFALSNGALLRDWAVDGGRRLHYQHDTPHPTYLVTLVVGDYVAIEDRAGELPVVSYVHPHQLEQGRLTFARTAEMVSVFEARTGIPYPYPRYSQIVVADFIFGGMENTTATSLTEHVLFDPKNEADVRPRAEALIAHELAHQWWGDLVTAADWAHGWLHEGFATYFEVLWRAHADGEAAADYDRLAFWEGYLGEAYRRPLVCRTYEEPIDLFDRHLYEKGALVLHLLRHSVGDEAFFRGLRHYCELFRSRTAESGDLRRALEDETGHSLGRLFDEWVHAPGHPELTVRGRFREAREAYELVVEQTQEGSGVPEIYHLELEVHVVDEEGRHRHRLTVEARRQTFLLPSPRRPRYVVFSPGGPLPAEVTLELPKAELRALVEDEDDVRAVIEAVRRLVAHPDPRSVDVVLAALSDHPFYGVRAEAARALADLPDENVQEYLMDAVLQDGHPIVRRAAIRALAKFTEAARPISDFLIRHMEIETSDYAIADSVRTLAELGTEAGRAFVHRALDRQGHLHVIRAAAVEGIARLRALDGLPRVRACTEGDNHPRVREAATLALGDLGRFAPARSLARIECREGLERLLEDPWLRVQIRAAQALATLGDADAAPALDKSAERQLDGRARRAMRLAAAKLRRADADDPRADALDRSLRRLEARHRALEDRLAAVERGPAKRTKGAKKKDDKGKKRKKR